MATIKLKIVNNLSSYEENCEWHGEICYIGRSEKSDICLPDKSQVISRRHAQVVLLDEMYNIKDLGSANFTYLNESRLEEDRNVPLKVGDQIRIGDYIIYVIDIELEPKKPPVPPPPVEEPKNKFTVNKIDPAILEQFETDFQFLLQIISRIKSKYYAMTSEHKDAALIQTADKVFNDQSLEPVRDCLVSTVLQKPIPVYKPSPEPKPPTRVFSKEERYSEVMSYVLDVCVKLISSIADFKEEYFGWTTSSPFLTAFSKEPEKLCGILLGDHVPAAEYKKWFDILKKELDKVMLHEVAWLDSHKYSIKEGVQELLRDISYPFVEKEITAKIINIGPLKVPGKIVPFLLQAQVIKELKKRHMDTNNEDVGVLDEKYFRQAFELRYLKHQHSMDSSENK